MKTEDKELLLKYLCARLPHGIKVQVDYSSCNDDPSNIEDDEIVIIDKFGEEIFLYDSGQAVTLEDIKPYLRSMSSMTDVERGEYEQLCNNCQEQDLVDYNISHLDRTQLIFVIDLLNQHHFDYRGLIEKGLALEAPKWMYKATQ